MVVADHNANCLLQAFQGNKATKKNAITDQAIQSKTVASNFKRNTANENGESHLVAEVPLTEVWKNIIQMIMKMLQVAEALYPTSTLQTEKNTSLAATRLSGSC